MSKYKFGTMSARNLATVKPALRGVLIRALDMGVMDFSVIAGKRTQAEQDRLYAQGRTEPGPIVTWTRNSRHLTGDAVDIVPYPLDWQDEIAFAKLAGVVLAAASEQEVGLDWGYDLWGKDMPHFELQKVKHEN